MISPAESKQVHGMIQQERLDQLHLIRQKKLGFVLNDCYFTILFSVFFYAPPISSPKIS